MCNESYSFGYPPLSSGQKEPHPSVHGLDRQVMISRGTGTEERNRMFRDHDRKAPAPERHSNTAKGLADGMNRVYSTGS